MRIWFHGTDPETAEKIGRAGFRPGTYFAAHLEDALAFGGEVVFEVALDHEPVKADAWQICVGDRVAVGEVVSITRYHRDCTFENEKLRNAVFKSNEP